MMKEKLLSDINNPLWIKKHNITGVSIDSRLAQKGDIFIAIPSQNVKNNVLDAFQKGVRVFILDLHDKHLENDLPHCTCYISENTRQDAAFICGYIYQKKPKTIAYVTGTNGKSSTVSLLRQIWQYNNIEAASIGTLGIERSFGIDKTYPVPSLTSLDPVSFHKTLSYLFDKNIEAVACEASSHGIDQFRLDGVPITTAGFTNLTQDHLDYHKTMDAYFDAKSLLFSRILEEQKTAVINADSPYFEKLKTIAKAKNQNIIAYGKQDFCDFKLLDARLQNGLYTLDLCFLGNITKNVLFPLFGNFQFENLLCASAMAFATGIKVTDIIATILHLKSIKGRMELIGKTKTNGLIFVDYAHTPDALERILKSIRSHNPNQVHLVFGCGGNRDASKRPIMGKIANDYADKIYITNDNPRFENAKEIRSQILSACPKGIEREDRAIAIAEAIQNLKENDILIIAGKGHEEGQIINGEILPFSDQDEAKKYISRESLE
jgi:UDP-N-acetylmuramoyl-L-alanyl-D-glutamate--2,6-diaminopimelate ligase